MNNPRAAHDRTALQIARLLAWLEVELERYEERVAGLKQPARLWPLVRKLAYIQSELVFLLMHLSGKSEGEINDALDSDGGDNHE